MVYTKFDPQGQRENRNFSLIPKRKNNPFLAFLQILLILFMTRCAMVMGGMPLIWIPYVDGFILKLLAFIQG